VIEKENDEPEISERVASVRSEMRALAGRMAGIRSSRAPTRTDLLSWLTSLREFLSREGDLRFQTRAEFRGLPMVMSTGMVKHYCAPLERAAEALSEELEEQDIR
jgi:hypothetical protein